MAMFYGTFLRRTYEFCKFKVEADTLAEAIKYVKEDDFSGGDDMCDETTEEVEIVDLEINEAKRKD